MSNLTVSYVGQPPAAVSARGPAAAPAADSPLGFLAALVDQVLAPGSDTAPTTATTTTPGLVNFALTNQTAGVRQPSEATSLFASLNMQLDALAAGEITPDQLADLQTTIETLSAFLDKPAQAPAAPTVTTGQIDQLLVDLGLTEPPVTTTAIAPADPAEPASPDIVALRDRLLGLSQSVADTAPDLALKLQTLAAKLEPAATDPALAARLRPEPSPPDPDALTIAHIIRSLLGHADSAAGAAPAGTQPVTAPPQDDALRVLATLGLNTAPSSPSPANEPAAPGTAVPAPLLRLSNQLTQVAQELTATAPGLAQKLDAVATRLVSADTDPALLGKLTSAAAQPDGTALDKLVLSLIEGKPAAPPAAAAPQIAAPRALTIPAALASTKSKSAVTEARAAQPQPAPAAADAVPDAPAHRTSTGDDQPTTDPTPAPKAEAKGAATVAELARTDPAAHPTALPQQPASASIQHARALPAAYQPPANPINMGQVAFEMARQVHQGTSRFTIRLDPPELGRVDVRMHIDASGTLNARLTVDRAETLDLFQRDQRALERALVQAGLDAGKTYLEFSLRQQGHNPFAGMMGGEQRQHSGQGGTARPAFTRSDDVAPLPAVTLYRGTASPGGVNIFV